MERCCSGLSHNNQNIEIQSSKHSRRNIQQNRVIETKSSKHAAILKHRDQDTVIKTQPLKHSRNTVSKHSHQNTIIRTRKHCNQIQRVTETEQSSSHQKILIKTKPSKHSPQSTSIKIQSSKRSHQNTVINTHPSKHSHQHTLNKTQPSQDSHQQTLSKTQPPKHSHQKKPFCFGEMPCPVKYRVIYRKRDIKIQIN